MGGSSGINWWGYKRKKRYCLNQRGWGSCPALPAVAKGHKGPCPWTRSLILGQGKGLTPRAPSSRCPRELFNAILYQILRTTAFLGMASETHQVEKRTNPAFTVKLNIIPGRYMELKPFFWCKGTFDLIGKNISSALGIVTVNWMQQRKRKKEHADPRELPNQLTTNSETNFCIAS